MFSNMASFLTGAPLQDQYWPSNNDLPKLMAQLGKGSKKKIKKIMENSI